jgi:hypothetical protein
MDRRQEASLKERARAEEERIRRQKIKEIR